MLKTVVEPTAAKPGTLKPYHIANLVRTSKAAVVWIERYTRLLNGLFFSELEMVSFLA